MNRKIVVFIFTLLFIFLSIPTTALGDNSSGDHQNTYDELEEISQIYRRFVSVKTNEDCSSFAVVINDAANWGRAEEIAESQLYDFAQKHANSGNKNDVIDIHYMNMNGDEVYFHRYNGSVVLPTAAETYSSSVNSSSAVSTANETTGNLADSSGDHQNTDLELEEMSQIYRRYVSVKANEDCSSFTVVINDAANWGRAEEIAEAQLYDFAQKHANSGNKNDVIDIHYMNMNGDEVYFHRYNGSVVIPTVAETYSSSTNSSSAVSTGSSTTGSLESGNSNGNLADYSSENSSSAALTGSSGSGSSGSDVSNWHLADNSSATSSSAYSSTGSSQGNYVLNTNTGVFHRPGCRAIKQMSPEHRVDVYKSRDEIAMNYNPCGICKP